MCRHLAWKFEGSPEQLSSSMRERLTNADALGEIILRGNVPTLRCGLTPPTISQAPRGLDAIGYSVFGLVS
jgi:hypothetical protein